MKKILAFFKNTYIGEFKFFKKNYLLPFLATIVVFFVIFAFSYFLFLMFPEVTKSLLVKFLDAQPWIKDAAGFTNWQLFRFILDNNIKASLYALSLGFIPFCFLPIIFVISNAALLGLVMSSSTIAGMSFASVFTRMILPHAIFELPAFFYAITLGLFFNIQLIKKVTKRTEESAYRFREILKRMVYSFVLVVVPLLLIAAFVESFVTVWFAQ